MRHLDYELIRKLNGEGLTDYAIAKKIGSQRSSVGYARCRMELPTRAAHPGKYNRKLDYALIEKLNKRGLGDKEIALKVGGGYQWVGCIRRNLGLPLHRAPRRDKGTGNPRPNQGINPVIEREVVGVKDLIGAENHEALLTDLKRELRGVNIKGRDRRQIVLAGIFLWNKCNGQKAELTLRAFEERNECILFNTVSFLRRQGLFGSCRISPGRIVSSKREGIRDILYRAYGFNVERSESASWEVVSEAAELLKNVNLQGRHPLSLAGGVVYYILTNRYGKSSKHGGVRSELSKAFLITEVSIGAVREAFKEKLNPQAPSISPVIP